MRTAVCLLLLSLLSSEVAPAQSVSDTSRFRPLDLPAANAYRTASGRPGPRYWQQQVDYRIRAELDTARNELHGRETVHYVNNSPDALPYLWMFLEQNICAPGSITKTLNQPPLVFLDVEFDFSCKGFSGGVKLSSVRIGGREVARQVYGTTMKLPLERPLAPQAALDIDIEWS